MRATKWPWANKTPEHRKTTLYDSVLNTTVNLPHAFSCIFFSCYDSHLTFSWGFLLSVLLICNVFASFMLEKFCVCVDWRRTSACLLSNLHSF
jgi:hypothetical protein